MCQRFLLMLLVTLVAFGNALPNAGAEEAPEQIGLYESNGMEEWIPTSTQLSVEPPAELTGSQDFSTYSNNQAVAYSDPAAQPDTSQWLAASHEESAAAAKPAAEKASEPTKPLEISVTADWVSKYMFRGFDILDDSGAYQPSVDIGIGCGLHLNWWASYASHDRGHTLFEFDQGGEIGKSPDVQETHQIDRFDLDEHDYTVYWGGDIADCIDVELGFIYYDFIHLNSNADFMEGYGTFTLSDLPLSPHFAAYYGWEKNDDTLGEGWNTNFGVAHSVPLCGLTLCGSDPLTLDLAADLLDSKSTEELQGVYESFYADSPFARVLPQGEECCLKAVQGSNFCDLSIHQDERTNRLIVTAVIDNLLKGASGQAVQNMNLALGFPETAGLMQPGMWL